MSADGPLLTAHEGNNGPFVNWLKDIGLEEFLKRYPVTKLVEWGWLAPQSRVVFPTEYFMSLSNHPYWEESIEPIFKPHASLWGSSWFLEPDKEELWFLHPFFWPDDPSGRILFKQDFTSGYPSAPDELNLSNGRSVKPYADYYFHWQGYALIDVIRHSDAFQPILNTPDVKKELKDMEGWVELTQDWDAKSVLSIAETWGGGLREPMTWLSHYRALRGATAWHEIRNKADDDLRRSGAKNLASYFGISVDSLTEAIREKILVLAQQWNWTTGRHRQWVEKAKPYLQTDIAMAMEWLCYLSDKKLDYYLDAWQYPYFGNHPSPELHKILPHEFFTDRAIFFRDVSKYLKAHDGLFPEAEKLDGTHLKRVVDQLRENNGPFNSFLAAFRQLHDELSYRVEHEGGQDFRNLRPLDHYSLLAIRAEGAMRYAIELRGLLHSINSNRQGLRSYIVLLAKEKGVASQLIESFEANAQATLLHDTPDDPIGSIMKFGENLPAFDRCLLQSFLCCLLARNYFAHHSYLDRQLLRSEKSGFLLTGILITVLYLLPQSTRTDET